MAPHIWRPSQSENNFSGVSKQHKVNEKRNLGRSCVEQRRAFVNPTAIARLPDPFPSQSRHRDSTRSVTKQLGRAADGPGSWLWVVARGTQGGT